MLRLFMSVAAAAMVIAGLAICQICLELRNDAHGWRKRGGGKQGGDQ